MRGPNSGAIYCANRFSYQIYHLIFVAAIVAIVKLVLRGDDGEPRFIFVRLSSQLPYTTCSHLSYLLMLMLFLMLCSMSMLYLSNSVHCSVMCDSTSLTHLSLKSNLCQQWKMQSLSMLFLMLCSMPMLCLFNSVHCSVKCGSTQLTHLPLKSNLWQQWTMQSLD